MGNIVTARIRIGTRTPTCSCAYESPTRAEKGTRALTEDGVYSRTGDRTLKQLGNQV